MLNTIGYLIEPDTDDDKKFNLSLKQLQFIQQDNNVKFMNNIIKSMKQYKLEVEDINNILEKYVHNEQNRIDRNEARRLKTTQEVRDDNNDKLVSILSNKSSNTKKRTSKNKFKKTVICGFEVKDIYFFEQIM